MPAELNMKVSFMRVLRSAASYIPSKSMLALRHLKDLPLRMMGQPHEADFRPLHGLSLETPIIIDIGANRGQSIESFMAVLTAPVLHAVEPNPILARSLQQRYKSITVYQLGLGEKAGNFILHIPRYGHTYWDTRASLDKTMAESFLSPKYFAFFNPKRAAVESISVQIRTLDDINLIPQIVKIDAEGLEASILRGATRTLKNHPIILLESCDQAVLDILVPLGYEPYHARSKHLEPGPGQLNTYFLSEAHKSLFTK